MPQLTVDDGSELYYEVHGEGSPTIVFAHGAGGNHLSWWQQVPHFLGRHRCITFDHRGFGQSTDASGEMTSAYLADFEALLEAVAPGDRVVLVAQSMGGWTCMTYAAAHPERVAALVMADTVLGIGDDELMSEVRRGWDRLARNTTRPRQTAMVASDFGSRHPARLFLYQQFRALNPERELNSDFSVAAGAVPREIVEQLPMPVLFVAGDEDALIPAIQVRKASEMVSTGRYVEVPQTGHSVYWERPTVFNQLLGEFLAEL